MPGFEAAQPSAIEIATRTGVFLALELVIEFLILIPVLFVLRRPMDLTFPEGPAFYRRVLVVAAAMAVLGLIPWFGGILGLLAVVPLTMKFFDGSILSGAYVALAMFGAHHAILAVLLALGHG